jgi:hypothetical protein
LSLKNALCELRQENKTSTIPNFYKKCMPSFKLEIQPSQIFFFLWQLGWAKTCNVFSFFSLWKFGLGGDKQCLFLLLWILGLGHLKSFGSPWISS